MDDLVQTYSAWFQEFEAEILQKLDFGSALSKMLLKVCAGPANHFPKLKRDDLYYLMMLDPGLKKYFDDLPSIDQENLKKEIKKGHIGGSSGNEFKKKVRKRLEQSKTEHPDILEANGSGVEYVARQLFENWGKTIRNFPEYTFIPKTKMGICNIVKWAKENNKKVRVSGYRHTWTDIYAENGEILISLLPQDIVEKFPAPEPEIDPNNELQGITMVPNDTIKGLCKVGSATTNEQFRRWCLHPSYGNLTWTLPLNVIMVEITFGGSNAAICHGAGIKNKTLSDLVYEIEFVNANGCLQKVNNSDELKAAAGCFGLLGIVTSITLKLDEMSYARMMPEKKRLALAIPPPSNMDVPQQIDMRGIRQDDLDKAWADFISRCENDYYAEWFWFPNQKNCWVNTWKNDGKKEDAVDYPGNFASKIQATENYIAELANDYIFRCLPGNIQANVLACAAMAFLPANKTITTPVIDALHFRRGIQNMRVFDMEMEIPIPESKENKGQPDFRVCQEAWWAVIEDFYTRPNTPMRMTLEMRVMGNSDIAMAPQNGNKYGTCSIEVLTTGNVDREEWQQYIQDITDKWAAIKAENGAELNIRPHWAKQWKDLYIKGQPIESYLKNVAYKTQIPIFRSEMQKIAFNGGFTLDECRDLFGNPLLERIIF